MTISLKSKFTTATKLGINFIHGTFWIYTLLVIAGKTLGKCYKRPWLVSPGSHWPCWLALGLKLPLLSDNVLIVRTDDISELRKSFWNNICKLCVKQLKSQTKASNHDFAFVVSIFKNCLFLFDSAKMGIREKWKFVKEKSGNSQRISVSVIGDNLDNLYISEIRLH